MCEEIDMPTEIGLLHKAQSKDSHPLVYDLIEWLRPFIVDHIVYTHFSKKKKVVVELESKDIPILISKIKLFLEKAMYHSDRKACITVVYWIKLYLLEVRNAVTEQREFNFIFPPLRHDTRCSQNKKTSQGKFLV